MIINIFKNGFIKYPLLILFSQSGDFPPSALNKEGASLQTQKEDGTFFSPASALSDPHRRFPQLNQNPFLSFPKTAESGAAR